MEAGVSGQRFKHSDGALQVEVPVYALLVEFFDDCLLEFGRGDVAVGQAKENALKGVGVVAVESFDPLYGDGGNNSVEVVVNH